MVMLMVKNKNISITVGTKIYFHVNSIAAVRRLLLLISANNRPTTLFRFESSRVTAIGKMVDN